MRLQQLAWFLWMGGTALIVGSWVGAVPPLVGWIGFGIAGVGTLTSWVPGRADQSHYPLTQEGFPVEPSGSPIPDDMALASGTPLLAYSQGRWWRATVISSEENGDVIVTFPGWDDVWTQRVPRKSLQIDPDPSRMPISVPPGALERWRGRSGSEDVMPPNYQDGVRG